MREKMKALLGLIVVISVLFSLSACDSSSSTPPADFYELEVEVLEGDGVVEVSPDKDTYENGTEVEIKAIPDENFNFVEWRGSIDSSEKEETVVVDSDMKIGAIFEVDQDITGQGTSADPFLIYTADGLSMIGEEDYGYGDYYMLARDIDLSSFSNWDPIGSLDDIPNNLFSGSLDGNGYAIQSLNIDTDQELAGLFLLLIGEVNDLSFVDASVRGDERVGILAGQTEGAVVENVSVTESEVKGQEYVGAITGGLNVVDFRYNFATETNVYGGNIIGGLAGTANFGTVIEESYFDGNLNGETRVGGLIGELNDDDTEDHTIIRNSYAIGNVSGIEFAGGLVGHNYGLVKNSYSATEFSSNGNNVGGAVASNEGVIDLVYYDMDLAGVEDSEKGIPKSTDEMMDRDTFYYDWNFDDIWMIEDSYPLLQSLE